MDHQHSKRRRGQSTTEYGIALSLIAVLAVVALVGMNGAIGSMFSSITGQVASVGGAPAPDATATPSPSPTPTPTGCPDGQSHAEYFANMTMSGTPASVGCESGSIYYDWGFAGPGWSGLGGENFSVRWNGNFDFPTSTLYAFTVTADDGIRLYVDNTLLLDYWIDQSGQTRVAGVNLSAGIHTVRLEYYQNLEAASVQMDWAPMVAPDAPLYQGAMPSSTSVLVDWVSFSPADSIVLYNDAGVQVAITSGSTYELLAVTGLSPSTTYSGWYLVARNQAGDSLPSDPFGFTTGP
jgi:Flp pilus assembly pilin Flp